MEEKSTMDRRASDGLTMSPFFMLFFCQLFGIRVQKGLCLPLYARALNYPLPLLWLVVLSICLFL
jgi:hypothetical protein